MKCYLGLLASQSEQAHNSLPGLDANVPSVLLVLMCLFEEEDTDDNATCENDGADEVGK